MRPLAVMFVLAACLACAPSALADNVGISLSSSSPEQGIPLTITLAGSSGAIDSEGDGAYLYAVARPSGGSGCQSSFGADQQAAGDVSTVLVDGDEQDPGQAFSEQTEFTPDAGGSLVCAWVESDGDDGDDIATPDEVTAGPISSTFTSAGPQVGPIKISVPSLIKAGQAYDITYSTQTDQDLTLDSIVIPAGGGCAASYELESDDLDAPDDVLNGGAEIYGTASTTGIDNQPTAGSDTICTWIEGPDDAQIDATSATTIKVLAAGTSAPAAGSSSSGGSGSRGSGGSGSGSNGSGSGSGSSGSGSNGSGSGSSGSGSGRKGPAACVVPTYSGLTLAQLKRRLLRANCSVGVVRRVRTARLKPGYVLRLSDAAGRQLKHGAAVAITIAKR